MNAKRTPTIVLTYGWGLGTPGGVARHLQELSRSLGRSGAKVIVVCVSAASYSGFPRPCLAAHLQGYEAEEELAKDGVEVVRVDPHPLHWTLDGRPVRDAVARILKEREVDCVLSFFNEASELPDLCRRKGVRFGFIATWLSYRMALEPERQGSGLRGLIQRRANRRFVVDTYRRAEVLFANSEFTRSELIDVLGCDPARIHVTNLGVKPFFHDIPRDEPRAVKRFVFFGRLVREKGIGDAIQALAKLSERGKGDWEFRILGSGNVAHVLRLAREAGIVDRVRIVEHQGDEGLARELAEADVALLPSHSESFGLAIAEAQAAGLPVVAYAAGSVPEVVSNGETAWLAPLQDVEALSQAIEAAIDDPAEAHRRGLAGRERVARLFRWDLTAQKVLAGLGEFARERVAA